MVVNGMLMIMHEAEVHCDELDQAACSASDECEWHADDNACEGFHSSAMKVNCIYGLAQEACEADEDCDWHDNHCDAVVACGTLNQEYVLFNTVANGMLMIMHVKLKFT